MQRVITTRMTSRGRRRHLGARVAVVSKACGLLLTGTLAVWAQACGEAEDQCIPGETVLCEGPGGCRGARACARDGAGFGACDCGDNLPLSADAGVEPAAREDVLAARCETDEDCGTNLRCWSARDQDLLGFSGGPAGGYCTATCRALEDCTRFDPTASCGINDASGTGLCFRGCLSKEPEPGEQKCLDREDLICFSYAASGDLPFDALERQPGSCAPSCASDAECGGRFCDPTSGRCSDVAPSGADIGAACSANAECAGGYCAVPVDGPAFCSAFCSLYAVGACAWGSHASPRQAACKDPLTANAMGAEGTGDLGLCRELCDTDSDCAQPGWFCITGPGLPERAGFCDFEP
jgi:hypothetical protein